MSLIVFFRHKNLLEDKADVVAFLTRTLLQKNDKISELQERLEGLQNIHTVEKSAHEIKLRTLEQDFVKMKEQLVSENMVLAKKLDALEEFKIQREQIMAKQAAQEEHIQELKAEYEKRIYAIEKKHIIEEDRLKNDMTAKLENVASEFRQASHAQMSATTQRTVRENVNLSAQVNQLSEKNASLNVENRKLDDGCRKIKKSMVAIEEEEKRLIHVNAHRYVRRSDKITFLSFTHVA